MKKFLMMACMMLFSTAMFAQQGAMYLGGNLNYGLHSDYKNFGFGVKHSMSSFRISVQRRLPTTSWRKTI